MIGYDARRKSDVFASDTARVMAAYGIRSMLFDQKVPTPVLAWSVTELDAAAGVVVTASHNPPADNGYKVYLGDGAQIVPPHDVGISARIEAVDPTAVPIADDGHPLIHSVGEELIAAYVAAIPAVRRRPELAGVPVAYTAMHGVGGAVVLRAFEAAGLPAPDVVAEQFEPDGTFPTVSFPNPEEPGAMDLLLEVARRVDAHVAIANDPDADRLGAAIPQPDGSWRRLGGDEIGWLFADYLLSSTSGRRPLRRHDARVVGACCARWRPPTTCTPTETFTGFKWIARAVLDHPEWRFVLGYEQALGYLVADRPLDKDGISAAVLFAEIAAAAARRRAHAAGLARRHRRPVRAPPARRRVDPDDAGRGGRQGARDAGRPAERDRRPGRCSSTEEYPEADLLRFELEGGVRVQIRPSGTEPKVKLYGEAVDEDPAPFVEALGDCCREPACRVVTPDPFRQVR